MLVFWICTELIFNEGGFSPSINKIRNPLALAKSYHKNPG